MAFNGYDASDRQGYNDSEVFVHDFATGEIRQLSDSPSDYSGWSTSPVISGDGEQVFFVGGPGIYVVDFYYGVFLHQVSAMGGPVRALRSIGYQPRVSGYTPVVAVDRTGSLLLYTPMVMSLQTEGELILVSTDEVRSASRYVAVPFGQTVDVGAIGIGTVLRGQGWERSQ